MMLKIYLFKNPISGEIEEMYEYPEALAGRAYLTPNSLFVTKGVLEPPILVIPETYLKEVKDHRISGENMYMDFKYYDHWIKQRDVEDSQKKFDEKLEKLQKIFGLGVHHLNNPHITFFAGPTSVFQQHFRNKVVFKDDGMLYIEDRGHFSLIKNCSIKDTNALFISGRFHSTKDEINDDTQCKISLQGA